MLYEDCLKLSRARVSEQQCCMEMAPNSRAHAFRSNSVPIESMRKEVCFLERYNNDKSASVAFRSNSIL